VVAEAYRLANSRYISPATYLRFWTSILHEGVKPLERLAEKWRSRAMRKGTKHSFAKKLFLASTVMRSLTYKVPSPVENQKRQAAIQRFTRKDPVSESPDLLKDLKTFINKVLPYKPKRNSKVVSHPKHQIELNIGNKACIEASTANGGCLAGLALQSIDAYDQGIRRTMQEIYSLKSQRFDSQQEKMKKISSFNHIHLQNRRYDLSAGAPPNLQDAVYSFNAATTNYPPMKLTTIPSTGGRIRIATIHSAAEVTLARSITQKWLPYLKGIAMTRDALRGKQIKIKTVERDYRTFSADMSKATDHISHRLATFVAKQLNLHLDSKVDNEHLERIFGPHTLLDDETKTSTTTTCGIHMGLGPTWVVLCILNGFAAWKAGAKKDSYAICGDDLVGLWSDKIIKKYKKILNQMGIPINHDKSYIARRGVFCERLVVPSIDQKGVSKTLDVGHLSELSAAPLRHTKGHNRVGVCLSIHKSDISNLGKRTQAKLMANAPRHGGHLALGGTGRGVTPLNKLKESIIKGLPKVSYEAKRSSEVIKSLTGNLPSLTQEPRGSCSHLDASIYLKRCLRTSEILTSGVVTKPSYTSASRFCKPVKNLIELPQQGSYIRLTDVSVSECIAMSPLNSSARRKLNYIWNLHTNRERRITRMVHILNATPCVYYSVEDVKVLAANLFPLVANDLPLYIKKGKSVLKG
jgi:hypothetical protein